MALKDEILAAIAAKIEGQGTAVDAGSALPGILRGIVDYIDGIAAGIPAAQIQSDWNQSNNTKVDFIKNKPTIPAAQIQSDWSQADNTKLDFIKNKPTIPQGALIEDATFSEVDEEFVVSNIGTVSGTVSAGRPVYLRYNEDGNIFYLLVIEVTPTKAYVVHEKTIYQVVD